MPEPREVRVVAVIGAGTIGASWTALFLSRGMEVRVSDPNPSARQHVRRTIDDVWPLLSRLGLAEGAAPDRWQFLAGPQAAAEGVDFVQENAPERAPMKRELFAGLEQVLPPETVVASSSSGLLMSDLQDGLRTPQRFVIGHPFNPPHLIPLVEVVGGRQTSASTIAWCLDFYRHLGKRPIQLRREAAGHLANRLQAALWREAIHAVAEGIASVKDVDAAIAFGPGLRWAIMGPHMTFHLGGGEGGLAHLIAHLRPAMERWWETLGAPALTPELAETLVAGVAEEAGGRSIQTLSRERDAALVAVLEALEKTRGAQ